MVNIPWRDRAVRTPHLGQPRLLRTTQALAPTRASAGGGSRAPAVLSSGRAAKGFRGADRCVALSVRVVPVIPVPLEGENVRIRFELRGAAGRHVDTLRGGRASLLRPGGGSSARQLMGQHQDQVHTEASLTIWRQWNNGGLGVGQARVLFSPGRLLSCRGAPWGNPRHPRRTPRAPRQPVQHPGRPLLRRGAPWVEGLPAKPAPSIFAMLQIDFRKSNLMVK